MTNSNDPLQPFERSASKAHDYCHRFQRPLGSDTRPIHDLERLKSHNLLTEPHQRLFDRQRPLEQWHITNQATKSFERPLGSDARPFDGLLNQWQPQLETTKRTHRSTDRPQATKRPINSTNASAHTTAPTEQHPQHRKNATAQTQQHKHFTNTTAGA